MHERSKRYVLGNTIHYFSFLSNLSNYPLSRPRLRSLPSKTDSSDKLPRDPEKLAVTSSLHPFWHTKRGCVVICLVVLAVIAAIVGGAVGGAKAGRQKVDSTTSLASITTSTTPQTTSQASNGSTLLNISGTTFSTTTGSSGIVKTTQGTVSPAISTLSVPVTSRNSIPALPSVSPT